MPAALLPARSRETPTRRRRCPPRPGTPGLRQQMPRVLISSGTPAWEARRCPAGGVNVSRAARHLGAVVRGKIQLLMGYGALASMRFPPSWTVEQIPGGFKVLDANQQSLAYVYSRETERAAQIANVLPEDEARQQSPCRRDRARLLKAQFFGRHGSASVLTTVPARWP